MAAKFFTGLPLAGPDPECVLGNGERALAARDGGPAPKPSVDHSRRRLARGGGLGPTRSDGSPPSRACDESPVAGLEVVRG